MASTERTKLKPIIELFYKYSKGTSQSRKFETYEEFKNFKYNGQPIFSKSEIYGLLNTIEKRGTISRKNADAPFAMPCHGYCNQNV